MRTWPSLAFAIVGFVFHSGWCATSHSASAVFQGIGDLPGGDFESVALGVSADGSTVVGYGISGPFQQEPFRWTAGEGMIGLGFFPPEEPFTSGPGVAYGVSADGSVIVGWDLGSNDAFRWTQGGGLVSLGTLPVPGLGNFAYDVSDDGSVAVGESGEQAFRWTEETGMVGLGYRPGGSYSFSWGVSGDGATIVGVADTEYDPEDGAVQEAFRWTQAEGMIGLGDLPGGIFASGAEDISSDGSVIVGGSRSVNGGEAFRWTETEGMVGLGDIAGGAFGSAAFAVSSDGSVIVGQGTTANGMEAFLWDQSHGIRNLRETLISEYGLSDELTGWTLRNAHGVSADGRVIVGSGTNPDGYFEAWVVRIVPEPSSSLLLLIGSTALLMERRKRGADA